MAILNILLRVPVTSVLSGVLKDVTEFLGGTLGIPNGWCSINFPSLYSKDIENVTPFLGEVLEDVRTPPRCS